MGAFLATLVLIAPVARADDQGSWSPVAPMGTARYGAAAAQLDNGRVLVAGGLDASGACLSSVEIYDPSTNSWSAAAPLPQARAFATAVMAEVYDSRQAIDSGVLVVGGDLNGAPTRSTEIYLPSSNTWSSGPPLDEPRAQAAGLTQLHSDFVFVEGGQGPGTDPASGETYFIEPYPGRWSQTPPLDTGRIGATGVITDRYRALVVGGVDPGSSSVLATGVRSPLSGGSNVNSWLAMPSMSTARYLATAAPLAYDRMLVAGGSSSYPGTTALSSAEIYDDSFGRWTAAPAMVTPRYGAVSAPLRDGRVLVAGGSIRAGALASAEAFTPPPPAPPVNVSPPAVTIDAAGVPGSTAHIGNTLSPSQGTWQGDAIQYRYQWQVCGPTCTDVGSQLTAQYPPTNLQLNLTPDEVGAMVRVVVTASTGPSSTSVASPEIGPVYPAGVHLAASWYPELGISRRSDEPSIPILRDDVSSSQEVGYQVRTTSPGGAAFFPPISGVASFSPGQREIDITLPIRDHGVPVLAPGVQITLSNRSSPDVVFPSQTLAPLYDASAFVRDPANPLAITGHPASPNPLNGAALFADGTHSIAAQWARSIRTTNPSGARMLQAIATQPNTARFGRWNGPHPGWAVSTYLNRASHEQPGTAPMLSTYYLVDGHCGHWADTPAAQAAYHEWIKNLAEGIGTRPAVLFLEMDSLITVGCLSRQGLDVRMHELRDAINLLTNVPHLVTYLDAGAADALPAREAAHLLQRAGVAQIEGFFLNSTHFDWTSREIRYGEDVARMTGGKHFVVNTAENGRGPLIPRNRVKRGNEVLCDPPRRGLGPRPTTSTGFPNVDAFAWIANPGVSGGRCRPGAPPTGVFWPQLAIELAQNADYRVR